MITDYVPGAYMTHDMLHMRGGHQTSWLIDGVAIPNTKIASNVGPQIDPKDIDSLETQRGSYAADVGDRTYGVFNVLPRNGFECNRDGELLLSAGNLYTGEAQLSLGDHSAATAWYASAHRLALELRPGHAGRRRSITTPPTRRAALSRSSATRRPKISCASTRNTARTTFRFPTIPTPTTRRCTSGYYCSYGLRDGQTERDSFVIANWVHTLSPKALFSVAPFYHFNQSNYDSPATDQPCHHLAPELELWRRPGRCASRRRAEQLLRRRLLVLPERERSLRRAGQRRQRDLAAQHAGQRQRGAGRVLRLRPPAPGPLCHAARRRALLHLPRRIQRVRNLSAHRRNRRNSAPALGAARLLRPLLPARAAAHRLQLGAELREQPARRAKTPSRPSPPSATKSTSSASRFHTKAGFSTWTPSRTA